MSNNGVPVTYALGIIQGYWKWHQSIDHMTCYINLPLLLYLVAFSIYLTLKNIETLKSRLRVSHPAKLCTIWTSLKATVSGMSFCCW